MASNADAENAKNNLKFLIKSTLRGLIYGGTAASLYALGTTDDDSDNDEGDRIKVPLSRSHFMKALGKGKKSTKKPEKPAITQKKAPELPAPSDTKSVGQMTPNELAAYKRALLRGYGKRAEAPQTIKKTTGPVVTSTSVGGKAQKAAFQPRDTKGRFEDGSIKKAGIMDELTPNWNNIKGQVYDMAGLTAGLTVGTLGVKKVFDRIRINRKKQAVEKARQEYVRLVNREVNDNDDAYYQKKAADGRSAMDWALGTTLGLGVGMSTLSALVVYRIMENRRKQRESEADKDTSRFPSNKTIEYKFV